MGRGVQTGGEHKRMRFRLAVGRGQHEQAWFHPKNLACLAGPVHQQPAGAGRAIRKKVGDNRFIEQPARRGEFQNFLRQGLHLCEQITKFVIRKQEIKVKLDNPQQDAVGVVMVKIIQPNDLGPGGKVDDGHRWWTA